jgi:hypothetical protein|nr:MAG TPA: hypothetical protein [Caudoviricetes sp.]
MEYTIEEIQTMLNIVSAVLKNSRIYQCGVYTSTVYNIQDSDIATMRKWIAYWKQTIDRCNKTD